MKTHRIPLSVFWRAADLVALLLFADVLHSQAQGLISDYDLSSTQILLMNGNLIEGELTSFTNDSLALRDDRIAPPGSIVLVHLGVKSKPFRGKVVQVDGDTIYIHRIRTGITLRIPRTMITKLSLRKSPLSKKATRAYRQYWLRPKSIKYLSLKKKGTGTGASLGQGAGLGVAAALSGANPFVAPIYFLTVPTIFGLTGVLTEEALREIYKNGIPIDGNAEKFLQARKTIVKEERKTPAPGTAVKVLGISALVVLEVILSLVIFIAIL